MIVLAFAGVCSLAYLLGIFIAFHFHHRNIMRRRRWPKSQHASYFQDLKNWPGQ